MPKVQVCYFTVADAKTKVKILTQIATNHFLKKEKIQILVPDLKTLDFVDSLFWKEPAESFLPHSSQEEDFVTLSTEPTSSSIVFNLCSSPYPSSETLKTLYELEDISHPQKKAVFEHKFLEYQKRGWIVCAQNLGK